MDVSRESYASWIYLRFKRNKITSLPVTLIVTLASSEGIPMILPIELLQEQT